MATVCGMGYALLENVMVGLRMPYISSEGFFRNIRLHLYPVIAHKWVAMRTAIIQRLCAGGKKCDVAGDGHFDSPGWTAKFCTYSIMDIASGAIIDFFVSQRAMYNFDLEMEAAREVLSNLVTYGLNIHRFVTDENSKISKMVRDNFKKIVHCLDIWHKARLLKKKLNSLAKTHVEITKWIPKIVNHFWHCCQTCDGDPQVLLEKFHGLLLHICNKHAWVTDPLAELKAKVQKEKDKMRKKPPSEAEKRKRGPGIPYFTKIMKCSHRTQMRHRRLKGTNWMSFDDPGYISLFRYLTDTKFCNSLKKCCQFLHTGGLEVYHNVRLKLMPKRSSYKLVRMVISSMLVAIEVNENLETESDENNVERRKYWKWSRSQKKYVPKQRILKKDFSFRSEIMDAMMTNLERNENVSDIREILEGYGYIKRPIPQRIVPVDPPQSRRRNLRSRFR